jgi:hypothetical protein
MRRVSLLLSVLLFALPFFGQAAETATEIPFTFVDGFILVKAQVEGAGAPLTFLVDSGASTAVVSLRVARRLHLPLGAAETVRGVGADALAYHLPPARVMANGVTLSRLRLAVDLHNASALCSREIDGLVGVDFFKGRIVQIDYANQQLRLLKNAPQNFACRLPLRVLNGVFCAGISVNGSQPRWTRVDTGCNDALHWVVPSSSAPESRGVSIGFITDQENLTRAAVQIGPVSLGDVQTSLHGEPLFAGESGLLGNGILSKWTVTVDGVHREISLQAPR